MNLYRISLVLCLLCVGPLSLGQTFQSKLSRIIVDGNKFVTEEGTPIIFRGLNVSDPDKLEKEGKWNERHFEEIRHWGANLVRFPVHPKAWRDRGKESYLELLDKGIAMAEAQGLYVIIDWHSIGNLKDEKFQRDIYETTLKETVEFWELMAKRYRGNNTVAFFELFNEPTVMNGQLGDCTWEEWREMVEEMIFIIRHNGGSAIPLVAGFNWAYDLKEAGQNPIRAEGIGYVSHPYPQKRDKPWEDKWTEDWGFMAEKYPLILTEMGFCGPDDKGAHVPVISDESYGEAITKYTDERGISYVLWVFDPDWSPMLFSDWDYTPTRQGRYFKKVMQEYSQQHFQH